MEAALELGATLRGGYHVLVSGRAQRATQTLACLACALRERVAGGAVIESRQRSNVEDRWRHAYALRSAPELDAGASPEQVRAAIADHAIARGQLTGRFER